MISPAGKFTMVTMPLRRRIGNTTPGDHDSCAYPGFDDPAIILAFGLSQASCTPYIVAASAAETESDKQQAIIDKRFKNFIF
jgi:hypothetical protein